MSIFKDNVKTLEKRTSVDFKGNVSRLGGRLTSEKPSLERQEQALRDYSNKRTSLLTQQQFERGGFDEFGRKVSKGTAPKYTDFLAKQQGREEAMFTQNPILEFRKHRERTKNFASRFSLADNKVKEEVNQDILPKLAQNFGLLVPRTLFGSGTDLELSGNTFGEELKSGGVAGFLYQETLKSNDELKAARYDKLVGIGTPPERAFEIAQKWQDGENDPADLPLSTTEEERKAMRSFSAWRAGFLALELADLLLIGKPINTALKSASRVKRLSLFKEMSQAKNARDAREILRLMQPQLAEKEGSEEIITIAQRAGKTDSWKKIITDNKRIDEILNTVDEQKAIETTSAQRVFFEGGIPILRGADDANLQDTLKFRQTQRDILSGGATKTDGSPGFWTPQRIEASRLSADKVFASERKAGTVTFSQSPDEELNVFIADTGFTGSLLKPGARVALTEQAVKDGLKASQVKVMQAFPDDLVRLPDGTFIYAPRETIGKDLTPTLQGIRAEKAQKVADAERKIQEGNLKAAQEVRLKEQRSQQLAEEVAKKAREKADQAAIAREKRIAQSKNIVENTPKIREEVITRTVAERTAKTEELVATARASRKAVSTAKKTFSDADKAVTAKVNEITAAVEARSKAAIKAFKKTRAFKKLTPKQQAEALAKFRKDGDALIAKLQKEKNKLNTERNTAKEALKKSLDNVIDTKTEKAKKAEIAREAKATKAQELDKLNSELTKAEQALLDDGIEVVTPTKKKTVVPSNSEKPTQAVKTIYREVIKEVTETAKVAEAKQIKAIDTGKGAEIKSAISSKIKENLATQLKAEGLSVDEASKLINPTHRVAANSTQMENAIANVVKSPLDEYNKFLKGEFPDNSSKAATELALMQHPLIKNDFEKVTAIIKKSSGDDTTRIAQEMQARNMLVKSDPHATLRQLYEFQADMMKKNEAGVTKEMKQVMDDLGNQLANLKVGDADEAIEIITKETCK